MSQQPTDKQRLGGRALYVALSLAVILAAAAALSARVGAPAWARAAAALEGTTETVVLLPRAAALEARRFHGPAVLAGVPSRLATHAPVVVVAGPGHDLAEYDALLARFADVQPLDWAENDDELRAARLASPRKSVLDLTRGLRRAEVVRRKGDAAERCRPQGRGHDCPGPGWRDVKPRKSKFDGREHEGVYLHPVQGRTTTLTYRAVPAGERLVLRLGIEDNGVRVRTERNLGPVRLAVAVNGVTIAELTVPVARGLTTHIIPLETTGPFDLTLETTADADYYADLYVSGEVLR